MWSGALDSSHVLLLYHVTSLASPITIILISTLIHTYMHTYIQFIYIFMRMRTQHKTMGSVELTLRQVSLSLSLSLRLKGLRVFFSILLTSSILRSGAFSIVSLAQHITTILISTLFYLLNIINILT